MTTTIPVSYYMQHVIEPNKETFDTFRNKIAFLLSHGYIDTVLYERYHPVEIEQLYKRALAAKYTFSTAEEVDAFYTDYSMRNRLNGRYLEDIEDRLLWCALQVGEGDSIKALRKLDAFLSKAEIPEQDLFMTAGKAD